MQLANVDWKDRLVENANNLPKKSLKFSSITIDKFFNVCINVNKSMLT